jgi:hypothetical protein
MGTVELKTNIHSIVDDIQNEQLLQTIYDFLKSRANNKTGKMWNSLSQEEKNEVLSAYDESENDDDLIEASTIFKIKK